MNQSDFELVDILVSRLAKRCDDMGNRITALEEEWKARTSGSASSSASSLGSPSGLSTDDAADLPPAVEAIIAERVVYRGAVSYVWIEGDDFGICSTVDLDGTRAVVRDIVRACLKATRTP